MSHGRDWPVAPSTWDREQVFTAIQPSRIMLLIGCFISIKNTTKFVLGKVEASTAPKKWMNTYSSTVGPDPDDIKPNGVSKINEVS